LSASLSTAEVKKRTASLVWVCHAVANGIPPETWPSLFAPALLNDVSGLYPIPPAKSGADPAETNLHRLAQVVSLFMLDIPPSPTPPAAPQAPGGSINTTPLTSTHTGFITQYAFSPLGYGSLLTSNGWLLLYQTRPTAPCSVTAHRFTPPGTLRGPGRSRAARSCPVWLGPTRIPAAAHPAQADSDPFPVSSLLGSGRLGSPAEHWARADSDPSVRSRHMTPATAASPGLGHALPRVCMPLSTDANSSVPRCGPAQQARNTWLL
jgi:hypothetical protein